LEGRDQGASVAVGGVRGQRLLPLGHSFLELAPPVTGEPSINELADPLLGLSSHGTLSRAGPVLLDQAAEQIHGAAEGLGDLAQSGRITALDGLSCVLGQGPGAVLFVDTALCGILRRSTSV